MWMGSNYIQSTVNSTYFQSSAHEPREEQAIEEDGHGPLGGLIWPPRSYSCSFCKREFRSPQALGGHMNVHRRDRARLNQPALCLKPCNNMLSSTSPSNHDSDTSNKVACLYHERKKESSVETSLSVGLNFGVSRYDQAAEDSGGCKKRRTGGSPVPFLFIACSSSDKDIDLELRLGDSPT